MAQPSSADPLVGATLAQYEILARIGGGGMGVVYAARDTRLGRRVALKFLPPQWSHDEAAKQRFVREAQAASATDHPNICTVHDIQETPDGRLFIVMAHYDGQTLKQKLEEGPLDIEAAVEIAAQAAEGLAKAHGQGVVHRDIKPGNLMICGEGVKILDFGLAKFATALQLTLEHSTLGTAAYMSPEQVKGEEADARSDVWSLGVVLYEMLAGRVPFAGAYAEAIGYAIRNETPAPLRELRPDVPAALEQIVFRALHKDPQVRYQSGREFARALRGLQGRTIAEDLLTQPLPLPRTPAPAAPAPPRRRSRRLAIAIAIGAVAAVAAFPFFRPAAERTPVAIVPFVNQTGYPELDAYRLALTYSLVAELEASPNVRVLPYPRLLAAVRGYTQGEGDVSSREAVQAIAAQSSARFLVLPVLVYEGGRWRARVEIQDAATGTRTAAGETGAVASSLPRDTAYALVREVAAVIDGQLSEMTGGTVAAPGLPLRLRSLDAARAFERGLNAYEELEYPAAAAAFAEAATLDPVHPLPAAWSSRALRLLRRDNDASAAAERAARLLTGETPQRDRLFVEAVIAESRNDFETAAARLAAFAEREPEEPYWLMEEAALRDRQPRTEAAVNLYQRVLGGAPTITRANVELCRLYNRLNDGARARAHAERALQEYRRLRARSGEGQALLCLADVLRVGGVEQQAEARRHADAAVQVFGGGHYPYNLPRAQNYVALTLEARGQLADALEWWQKALASSADGANPVLQPLVLMNLGVTSEKLGRRTEALRYLRDSFAAFERMGDQARAAENLYNIGTILISYGPDPEEGRRNVENALAVFRDLGNRNFEVAAAHATGTYYRHLGRHADAERELNRALALAKERNLDYELATSRIRLAQSLFDRAAYAESRALLTEALRSATGQDALEARIHLARVQVRLEDLAAAAALLEQARGEVEQRADARLRPELQLALGELAYRRGDAAGARLPLAAASAQWTDDMPHRASVEARAFLGFLERRPGLIQQSLAHAETLRDVTLATRCRQWLAGLRSTQDRGSSNQDRRRG